MQKFIFQCADDVTFAVRTVGTKLEVYPPEFRFDGKPRRGAAPAASR